MKTIGLTSPHTTGPDVRPIQRLLKKNWTGRDYLQGAVDGDFGTESARGCIRGKYWLGYPTSKQLPIAGDELLKLLSDQSALPLAYRVRRRARLKAQNTPLRTKALQRAEKDLGMK